MGVESSRRKGRYSPRAWMLRRWAAERNLATLRHFSVDLPPALARNGARSRCMNDRTESSDDGRGNRLSAAENLPEISKKEKDSIEAQSRPSAALIHETIRAEGES